MTKTQSQTGNITLKKEEEDFKPTLLLNGVNSTRSNNKIAKRIPSIINNGSLSAQQVKVEQDTDTKSLLQPSSNHPKSGRWKRISQEQINQLIRYIVNDNMSVYEASRKVNISKCSAYSYYDIYKNDPEKKIPVPRRRYKLPQKYYTQEQIGNFIKYVDNDKMTLKEASAKADVHYGSGRHYYSQYLKDPNHIHIPSLKQHYTQDQKEAFIGYIVTDKMSILAASKKAKMNHTSARRYYHRYFKEQNPDIPAPNHIAVLKRCTKEQRNEAVSYIINDKMSITAASRKVNMPWSVARKYYQQYLNDNNMEIPAKRVVKHYTQDQISELLRYIVDDKMSVMAASKKATIGYSSGRIYYQKYLKDHNIDIPQKCTPQDQISKALDTL